MFNHSPMATKKNKYHEGQLFQNLSKAVSRRLINMKIDHPVSLVEKIACPLAISSMAC
jgi:hypothetical protein